MSELDQWTEQKQARREVYAQRRAFGRSHAGKIAQLVWTALGEYAEARDVGVSQYDACKGFDGILRDVFPLTHYPMKCETCGDTGYQERVCKDGRRCEGHYCSREPDAAFAHLYVEPCGCPAGDKFRKKVWVPGDTDAPIAAGNVKRKARGFTRLGR